MRSTQELQAFCTLIRATINQQGHFLSPAYAGVDPNLFHEADSADQENKFSWDTYQGRSHTSKKFMTALSDKFLIMQKIDRRTWLKWTGIGVGAFASGIFGVRYFGNEETQKPPSGTTPQPMSAEDRVVLESITHQLSEATQQYYAEMRRLAHLQKPFNQLNPVMTILGQAIVQIFQSHEKDPHMPEISQAIERWKGEGKLEHMDLLDMVVVLQQYFERHNKIFIVAPLSTDIDGFFITSFYQVLLGDRVAVPGGEWTQPPVPGDRISAEELAVGAESISFLTPLSAFSAKKAWGREKPLIVYRIPFFQQDVEALYRRVQKHPTKLSLPDALVLIRAGRYAELTDWITSDLIQAELGSLSMQNAEKFRALALTATRRVIGLHEWGHLAESSEPKPQSSGDVMRQATDHEMLSYWHALGYSGFPYMAIQHTFGAASIAPGEDVRTRFQNPHYRAVTDFFNLLISVINSDRQNFSIVSIAIPADIATDPVKLMYFYLAQLASIPRDRLIALGKRPITKDRASTSRPLSDSPLFYRVSHWMHTKISTALFGMAFGVNYGHERYNTTKNLSTLVTSA